MSEVISKLIEVQNELKAPKGQYNKFGKYKYRSCEDILEAVKPLLHKHGLLLTLADEIVTVDAMEGCSEENGGYTDSKQRVYVKATATVTDGETSFSADGYARESFAKKGMDSSQVTGTASSYARKYALNGLFLIDDSKDDDTREPTDVKATKPQTGTNTAQAQQTPEISQQEPSEEYIQQWLVYSNQIKQLKEDAIALGVSEDGMKQKINLMLQGKKFTQASFDELQQVINYIQGLINDQKALKAEREGATAKSGETGLATGGSAKCKTCGHTVEQPAVASLEYLNNTMKCCEKPEYQWQ